MVNTHKVPGLLSPGPCRSAFRCISIFYV